MELLIKNKEEEMIVSFAGDKISINLGEDALENNVNWNTSKINDFLIKIASSLSEEDVIEVKADESEDVVYKHIVSLFSEFAKEYNKKID